MCIRDSAYALIKGIVKKVFGSDYEYQDYVLPFGKEEVAAADSGVNFVKLRVRSEGNWRKGTAGSGRCV